MRSLCFGDVSGKLESSEELAGGDNEDRPCPCIEGRNDRLHGGRVRSLRGGRRESGRVELR
jgi:hypothetical protein